MSFLWWLFGFFCGFVVFGLLLRWHHKLSPPIEPVQPHQVSRRNRDRIGEPMEGY